MPRTKIETILVYNENCVMAGRMVPSREVANYDGDPADCSDWHEEELSISNAIYHESYAGGHPNHYHIRIAQTIREAM